MGKSKTLCRASQDKEFPLLFAYRRASSKTSNSGSSLASGGGLDPAACDRHRLRHSLSKKRS